MSEFRKRSASGAALPASILFVDDQLTLAELGREMLEGSGYDVVACSCPRGALNDFRARPNKFDLAVVDMDMPEMTGVEFSKALAGIRPDMPIILCSGYARTLDREAARAAGVRDVVEKPTPAKALLDVIARVLASAA